MTSALDTLDTPPIINILMSDDNNIPILVNGMKIHPLANFEPLMTPIEQKALELSIEDIGQTEPIKLYRGRIVDGRSRSLACERLGIEVKSESYPNNMTATDLGKLVYASSSRRNLTKTQKAIKAAKRYLEDRKVKSKLNQKELCAMEGITRVSLTDALYILKSRKAEAERLFNDLAVDVPNTDKKSKSVQILAKAFRKIDENSLADVVEYDPAQYDLTLDHLTEAEKEWYRNVVKSLELDNTEDFYHAPRVKSFLVSIASKNTH